GDQRAARCGRLSRDRAPHRRQDCKRSVRRSGRGRPHGEHGRGRGIHLPRGGIFKAASPRRPLSREANMSNSIPLDLERAGTFVYTEEMALHGYRLTQCGLSLRNPANRKRFLADEAGYMRDWNLRDDEIAMVGARDWT